MKLHELAKDATTKFEAEVPAEEKDPCQLVVQERTPLTIVPRIVPPGELRPLPRSMGFLTPFRDAIGDKIVTEHGSYHIVPVIDEHSGTIVRRRMYEDGHLGSVEQY